ncbi:MAG TPA: hypothetical protein DGG95_15040, partial [Cytophagales bacterium]|nr:hypothetical protein [Cytophagales bacterium]
HNVDKSLEGKLNSVVFIPILSQIYCDQKSFAWQHEFCAFNRLASSSSLGREVALRGGNVTSRILPVVIHNLEAEDLGLIENEIKTKLRSIDFTFRSPGVNRPLRKEDKRQENVNNLSYHDQLNKLANAAKEIIMSIKNGAKSTASANDILSTSEPEPETQKATVNEKSLAVLPFKNLSQDASQEYFADGITENILTQLAGLRQYKVISRTSVMRFKNTTKSTPEIATELGVKFIIEGSVQTHKEKVRISVQLIDALSDEHVWSKIFVESMDDIFALQDTVANTVAQELHSSLAPNSVSAKAAPPTKNMEAYDLFLKGRHAFNQWSIEGYKTASSYFQQAIEKDLEFHDAYSFLASSYSARMSWNGDLSPIEALPHIEQYLNEAWKRGPSYNDYVTKAFVEFFVRKDFSAADQFFLKAIELNQNNADALFSYSYLLNMMGRFDEAPKWIEKAKSLDPLSVAYFNYKTISLHLLGKNEEALDVLQEGIRLFPSVVRFYDFRARIYLVLQRWQEAKEAIENGFRIVSFRPPSMVAYLAVAYHKLNEPEEGKVFINELIERSKNNERAIHINLLYYFDAVQDFSSALHWYKKAIETNDVGLITWDVDPLFKNVRAYIQENKDKIIAPDFDSAEKFINEMLEQKMPKLPYHNLDHVKDVFQSAQVIAEHENVSEEEVKIIRIAALLHDIGFIHGSKNHEQRGAEMAQEILPSYGFNNEQIEIISKMILATRLPQSPTTHLEKILCDADLDYLGRDDFFKIGNGLFKEMLDAGVVDTEREWNIMQRTFLQGHRYHTEFSQKHREPKKQEGLDKINSGLRRI